MIEYKIIEHMSYDWLVVTYFFLGGLAAGSYIFSVIANYWYQEFKPLAKTGAVIAPISLALGMLVLLFDLGQPLRVWMMFAAFNFKSVIFWGLWFIMIFLALSVIYAKLILQGEDERARKIAYAGLPFGVLVATYTGVLLAQAPGRALWHSPLIPFLFLSGGIISGCALTMLLSFKNNNRLLIEKLGKIIAGLLVLELGIHALEIITLSSGTVKEMEMARSLLIGNYSFRFLGLEILIGGIIPIYILLRKQSSHIFKACAAILVLIGIYAMRHTIVVGGQVPTF